MPSTCWATSTRSFISLSPISFLIATLAPRSALAETFVYVVQTRDLQDASIMGQDGEQMICLVSLRSPILWNGKTVGSHPFLPFSTNIIGELWITVLTTVGKLSAAGDPLVPGLVQFYDRLYVDGIAVPPCRNCGILHASQHECPRTLVWDVSIASSGQSIASPQV